MDSLKSKFLYQLLVSFLFSVTPLIVFPYVSRTLGPAAVGTINFIDYAVQFFLTFAAFGLSFYGAREVARVRDDRPKLGRLISELLLLHIVFTLLALISFALFIWAGNQHFSDERLLWIAGINIGVGALNLEWVVHGLEDFRFMARRSFATKILSLVLIFVLVRTSADYLLYYLILAVTNLSLILIDIVYTLKLRLPLPKVIELKKHLRPLSLFFITTVSLSVYTFLDTVILGLIAGPLAVGFYTTALKVIRILHSFISDLGGVLLPRITALYQKDKREEIIRLLNKSLQYVLTITLPLGVFLFFAAPQIIIMLGGKAFSLSVPVLQLLSLMPLIIGLTNIFFIQILLPFQKDRHIVIGVLIGTIVSVVANYLLCPLYEERGAAMSALMAEGFVATYLGWHSLKLVRFNLKIRFVGEVLISSLLFVPVILLVQHFLSDEVFVSLFSAAGLCGALYLFCGLILFRNPILIDMMQYASSMMRRKER